MTESEKLLRQVRKIIRDFRAEEAALRDVRSRSTGSRNVYRGGYKALADIERAVAPKGKSGSP